MRGLIPATLLMALVCGFSEAFLGEVHHEELARVGQRLFFTFLGLLGGALVTVAPWLGAAAMAEERDDATLEILGLTPVRPWQVILGKLASRFWLMLTAALGTLPIFLLIVTFGGVAPLHAVVAAISLAYAAAFLATLGGVGGLAGLHPLVVTALVWCWAMFAWVFEAAMLAGSQRLVLRYAASPVVAASLGEAGGLLSLLVWAPAWVVVLRAIGPIFRIIVGSGDVDDPLSPERRALDSFRNRVLVGVVALLVGPPVLLTAARLVVRRLPRSDNPVMIGAVVAWQSAFAAASAGALVVLFLVLQARLAAAAEARRAEGGVERPWRSAWSEWGRTWLRGGPRSAFRNPVAWREAAVGTGGLAIARLALLSLVLLAGFLYLVDGASDDAFAIIAFLSAGSAGLVGVATAATVVQEERVRGTLPLLLLTHLEPWRFGLGALLAAAWRAGPLIALSTFSWLGAYLIEPPARPYPTLLECQDQLLLPGSPWLRIFALGSWAIAVWAFLVMGSVVVAARVRPGRLAWPAAMLFAGGWWVAPVMLAAVMPRDLQEAALGWWFPMTQSGLTNPTCGLSAAQISAPLVWAAGVGACLALLQGRLRPWAYADPRR